MLTHMSRVEAVGTDWVQLERPLHTDVSPAFKPTLYRSFNFKVSGVGVEDLAIDFPWTPYLGHHEGALTFSFNFKNGKITCMASK
jgi:hypothetical protein